ASNSARSRGPGVASGSVQLTTANFSRFRHLIFEPRGKIHRSIQRSLYPPTGGEGRLGAVSRIGVSRQGRYTHMTEFPGRIAVVTGGGSGMGRELVRQLVAEACNVAMCDVSPTGLAETQTLGEAAGLPQGLRVTTHRRCCRPDAGRAVSRRGCR